MPAVFAKQLCGYRNGKPNTSDASQDQSVELGNRLFQHMGVPAGTPAPAGKVDKLMTRLLIADLTDRIGDDFTVVENGHLSRFEQYRHLAAARSLGEKGADKDVQKAVKAVARHARRTMDGSRLTRLDTLLAGLDSALVADADRRRVLIEQLGEESLLALDVAGYKQTEGNTDPPRLRFGLSLKWSLRTDRAQDCRSQGAKMASLRRGPMPHFATVTMEPRSAMLALLGRGSGDLDCVYHLDLPALTSAFEDYYQDNPGARARPYDTFRRLVEHGRVRDYDDLITYAAEQ